MVIAIIEDEIVYSDHLKKLIMKWADEVIVADIRIYANGLQLLKDYAQDINEIDIVFIDIQLPYISGIDLAGKLRAMGYTKTIVFTTNYAARAVDGYAVGAFRYYIKPIQYRDVKESMDYVLKKITLEYFSCKHQGITYRIPFRDIICFESMGHYVDIFVINQTDSIHIKALLKEILPHCPVYLMRCHRSYIVNINHIIRRKSNTLLLVNNKTIEVAARYSRKLNKILECQLYNS